MIPETMYDTSLETWELTLPEDEAGCESKYGCTLAATWRGIRPCCAAARCLCEDHKRNEVVFTQTCEPVCAFCEARSVIRWFRI